MITVSSNSGLKTRLVDRNPDRKWVAVGEGEAATITIALTSQIDTICVLNTNASEFTIKYDTSTDFNPVLNQDTVAWQAIDIVDESNNYLVDESYSYIVADGIASCVYNNFYFKVAAVTPSTNIVITITATTNNEAVRIGQIVATKQIHEIKAGGTSAVVPSVKQYLKEMSDGTVNKIFVRTIKGYEISLINATPQERANLLLMADLNSRDALFYIHRPAMGLDVFDGLCGHVNWENPTEFDDYYNDIAANGFTGIIRLSQAGGIN
jgi:hypothetical protein